MSQLTQGKRLAWNSLLNLGTGGGLLLLSIVFVPFMIHSFGTELYGVLTVTWMVLANLAWLDFGFSRASAKYVAQELAVGDYEQAALWSWTAILTQAAIGLCGSLALLLAAPRMVDLLQVQPERREIVILTLRLFALTIPMDLAGRSLNGVMQAGQRFDLVNGINVFGALWMYVVYAIGIWFGGSFRSVVYGLFALRIVTLICTFWGATQVLPSLKSLPRVTLFSRAYRGRAAKMLNFGWWVTIAATIGPLMMYFDQWAIGVMLGVAVLPFYTVPCSILLRLAVLPASLTTTLFPAFTTMNARMEQERMKDYFVRSHRYLFVALAPLMFVLFIWSPELLRLWIGSEFAMQASPPMRILIFGLGIGLMSGLSGALLEGINRPDLLAKLYIIELPLTVVATYVLIKNYGIAGAAISYALRCLAETTALWVIVHRVLPFSFKRDAVRAGVILVAMGIVAYRLADAQVQDAFAIGATLVALVIYCLSVVFLLLDKVDRNFLFQLLNRRVRHTASAQI